MKGYIYRRWLRGWIIRNRYMREVGLLEDKWYWGDVLAGRWGCYSVGEMECMERDVTEEHARRGTRVHLRNPYGSFWK